MKKKLLLMLFMLASVFTLSSCIMGMFEEEIKVNFYYEDELVSSDTLTQFKNIHTPELDESYIPVGYKFFGWTPLELSQVQATDENFKEEYIGDGKMVHYTDVEKYAKKGVVNLKALMIDKEAIPRVYHYVVIAWYSKTDTSGISEEVMNTFKNTFFAHLRSEGLSEEDIATIVIRGYSGNVGTSCGNIMADDDVDIMVGWGSASNVTETGGMKASSLLQTESLQVLYNGAIKNRTIHRLGDSESVLSVMEWLLSDECKLVFNPEVSS